MSRLSVQEMEQAFELFDTDASGSIGRDEVAFALKAMGMQTVCNIIIL